VLRLLTAVVVCGTGALVSCGAGPGSEAGAGGACGQPPVTHPAPTPRTGAMGSAGGSARVKPGTSPPPTVKPPRPAVVSPTPVNGRVALTAANTTQTIVVPRGTVIDVRLEPVSGAVWTAPESSDHRALPRLSASDACETVAMASFRAQGQGEIRATRPHGDAEAIFVVTIRALR
jgi:hypothetical protein